MVNYHAATELYHEPEVSDSPPSDLDFVVREVEDIYGTNNRQGVELVALADDGREWSVVTVIPGKRIRVHPCAKMLGLQSDGEYPGVKHV